MEFWHFSIILLLILIYFIFLFLLSQRWFRVIYVLVEDRAKVFGDAIGGNWQTRLIGDREDQSPRWHWLGHLPQGNMALIESIILGLYLPAISSCFKSSIFCSPFIEPLQILTIFRVRQYVILLLHWVGWFELREEIYCNPFPFWTGSSQIFLPFYCTECFFSPGTPFTFPVLKESIIFFGSSNKDLK